VAGDLGFASPDARCGTRFGRAAGSIFAAGAEVLDGFDIPAPPSVAVPAGARGFWGSAGSLLVDGVAPRRPPSGGVEARSVPARRWIWAGRLFGRTGARFAVFAGRLPFDASLAAFTRARAAAAGGALAPARTGARLEGAFAGTPRTAFEPGAFALRAAGFFAAGLAGTQPARAGFWGERSSIST
jgi:hypothetical protein